MACGLHLGLHFLIPLPAVVLCIIIFLNICKYRFSVMEIAAVAILAYLAFFIAFLSRNEILGNFIFALCIAAVAWRKTTQLPLSGYYAIMSVNIFMIGNNVADMVAVYIFDDDALAVFILQFAICVPLSRVIGSALHRTYMQLSYEIKQKFALYGFAVSALVYLLTHANMFPVDEQDFLIAILILVFVLTTVMTAVYSLSQQKQAEAILKSEAEKDLIDHTRQLQAEYDDMRSFRHDYRNLLSTLMGYDNIEDIKEHLARSLVYADEVLKNLDSVMSRLNLINIPELRGLLAIKFAHAQDHGVVVELDIMPVDDIPLNRLDLCRLAGIIVDNAIEAILSDDERSAEHLSEPLLEKSPKHLLEHSSEPLLEKSSEHVLKFAIVVDGDEVIIVCKNPINFESNHNTLSVKKIFDDGYTTKGPGRGYGLTFLKFITKENKNLSYTANIQDGEFTFTITIRGDER